MNNRTKYGLYFKYYKDKFLLRDTRQVGVDYDTEKVFKISRQAADLLSIQNLDEDRWPWKFKIEPLRRIVSGIESPLFGPTGRYAKKAANGN